MKKWKNEKKTETNGCKEKKRLKKALQKFKKEETDVKFWGNWYKSWKKEKLKKNERGRRLENIWKGKRERKGLKELKKRNLSKNIKKQQKKN